MGKGQLILAHCKDILSLLVPTVMVIQLLKLGQHQSKKQMQQLNIVKNDNELPNRVNPGMMRMAVEEHETKRDIIKRRIIAGRPVADPKK
jgi:hypothetical protein